MYSQMYRALVSITMLNKIYKNIAPCKRRIYTNFYPANVTFSPVDVAQGPVNVTPNPVNVALQHN